GNNEAYQLGDGTDVHHSVPVRVASDVLQVCAGRLFSLFLTSDHRLWSVGYDGTGMMGGEALRTLRQQEMILEGVERVRAGQAFILALREDDTLWAAGLNDFGQLGTGN